MSLRKAWKKFSHSGVGAVLNPLGIGAGGPGKAGMFGGAKSVLRKMHGPNTHMPDPMNPNSDQAQVNQFMTDTQNRYSQQQTQLQGVLDKYRQNAMQNLTTGPEGEQMRQFYNRMGLLNSGAFNQGLADRFGQIQQNSDLALMGQGLNTTDVLQNIAEGGLQRRFGIEDQNYQAALAQAMAKRRQANQRNNALWGLAGTAVGAMAGGPIGAAAGSSAGNYLGNIFGGGQDDGSDPYSSRNRYG